MEKCVDSDYSKIQYDSSKSPETWTSLLSNNPRSNQRKNKNRESVKVSRARKKIAAENRSVGRSDPEDDDDDDANIGTDKSMRDDTSRGTKLNVLKGRHASSARYSVQKNTKIIQRNVPDRLGKYVNSSVRLEAIGFPTRKSENFSFNDCPATKLGNECLSNKESVAIGDNNDNDTESKNIFEKIFDDCLGSTSVDASSQEKLNLEADNESVFAVNPKTVEKYTRLLENLENFKKSDARMVDNERTPMKSIGSEAGPEAVPSAPVKVKDHTNFYSHKKFRHVCCYCHKIFKSNGKLISHVYSHTGERPFDCHNCGKAFSSKFKLVRHLLIHSEIRKFVCQICNRTFLRNDHLKNHYKIHDPQKKMYKCPKEHCDKEYYSMMSHKKHMAYHSVEDGDLKCLICNVKFETKEEVLFHLKSHSGSRLFKSQSDKKFKCDFCDRLFLTRKDVTRHLVVHTGERDFLCQFCPQRFGRKDHLVRHIKKSHVSEGMKVKNEIKEFVDTKEEVRDGEVAPKKVVPGRSTSSKTKKKDSGTETVVEDPKTHIVITVKNPMQKRKWKSSDAKTKSFRKSESSVPNRKQVPLSKNKNSTTQIFLQNIPNILIIPNNSIILLRNQSSGKGKKAAEESESNETVQTGSSTEAVPAEENRFGFQEENFASNSNPTTDSILQTDFNLNYNFNSNLYQPSQFAAGFPYGEGFPNFQPDVIPFGQSFENLENYEMLRSHDVPNQGRSDAPFPETATLPQPSKLIETEAPSPEAQRKVGIVKPMMTTAKALPETVLEKDLFAEETDNLMIPDADSILMNDFKVDDSVILPLDGNDSGILNNLFGQSGSVDNSGNELLRNLLMSENPILSPLPGFSQIFNNSNSN